MCQGRAARVITPLVHCVPSPSPSPHTHLLLFQLGHSFVKVVNYLLGYLRSPGLPDLICSCMDASGQILLACNIPNAPDWAKALQKQC